MEKRYQYYSKDGIKYTTWFTPVNNSKEYFQLKPKLKNEYRTSNQ